MMSVHELAANLRRSGSSMFSLWSFNGMSAAVGSLDVLCCDAIIT